MQQRTVISKGKRFLVNVPTEDGVGAGFAVGQMVFKSVDDSFWYVAYASGSPNKVSASVSQSQLIYYGTSSFFDLNSPYQLLASSDGNTYKVFLTGSAPNASLAVSQSMYASYSFVTNSNGAIFLTAKPFLLLQNINDANYYQAYLVTTAGVTTLTINQTMISQSWVHPVF